MGVSLELSLMRRRNTNGNDSITKLMGESFKLHAQALVGYEDALASGSSESTPTVSSQDVDLDMDAQLDALHA